MVSNSEHRWFISIGYFIVLYYINKLLLLKKKIIVSTYKINSKSNQIHYVYPPHSVIHTLL